MRSRVLTGLFVVLCAVFFLTSTTVRSAAQAVYGNVLGTVTDQQGAAIAGAKVMVTSVSKGTVEETTTNADGNYTVSHLIPDVYNVRVEATGFKAYEVKAIQVSADTGSKVDAKLDVGSVTQSIEVTGEIPQLKTDRSDVSITFNEKYATQLPILNRNFTNFELLSPGTQKLVGWSHAATENPQGGQQIFVNGQHFSGTAFELDGTDNQDPILGIIVVNPNLDAIQESKIALQNYDAEFGKAVAGVVTVQTKSGSNEFHGSAFYDFRGDGLQARNPFTNPPDKELPRADFKQFGGALGGPIIKNKLFFFGDYQGTRQTNGISNQLTIPTARVLQTCDPAKNTTGFCDLSEYLGVANGGGQVFDPATGVANDGSGRTAFAGNLIPIGRISPQAGKILALFPEPTAAGITNNFVASGSGPYDQNAFDVRIDYNAPHAFNIFGRFSLNYFSLSGEGSLGLLGADGFGPGGLNGTSTVHNYSLATGFNKAIGTKWLTDVRFGWFRYNPVTAYSDADTNPMSDLFGIPGLNVGTPDTTGLSSFFFDGNGMNQGSNNGHFGDGLNVGRCNCPLIEKEDQYQAVNNWTRIQGNHTIKFGADIRYAKNLRVPSDANRTGILHFNSGGTAQAGQGGLDVATFLLGDVTFFERFVSSSTDAAERQKRWFFYGQDTWRVTSKLTFNYGLRWEIYFPETVNGTGKGGFANIDEGVIKVAGFGPVSDNGNTDNTLKAFAPRLGVAYQLDPKTVVRVGYGRSFDIGVFGSNFGHVVTQNLPVLANQNITDSSIQGQANFTNDRSAVFTLASGPPAFDFSQITNLITAEGTLPLRGPNNNVAPRIRPRVQRLPTLDAWNATLQRQLTPTMNIEIAYIGNKGTHVFAGNGPGYNANEAAAGAGTNIGGNNFKPFVAQANRRRFNLNGVPRFTYPGFTQTVLINGVPTVVPLTCCSTDVSDYFGNDSSSHYNALQVKLEKRFAQGLQFLGHYTYSRAYNYADGDTGGGYYSVDQKFSYGPDDFSRNHAFVISTVYELPVGKGKKFMSDVSRITDFLVGGWQVSNTTTWSGGLPFTPSIGECGQVTDAGPCRPDLLPGESFDVGKHTVNGRIFWFTPVAPLAYTGVTPTTDTCTLARPTSGPFALPACGQVGNAGRNWLRGPRAFFSDLSVAKSFNFTEKVRAQFRFDAYNVFNHPVLGFGPAQGNACIDCGGNAGEITNIEADASPNAPNGMRQLQFGLRFTF
jgi:hypothetical protein